ncbi:uncharacterized protein [Misgurnus anguillicaudatus]|uniref:uncharacterized protein isoform X2 n=1 Tax=Misgurnus anguillicaudatus TaxID=75329 RepID=UPI003CCF7F3F
MKTVLKWIVWPLILVTPFLEGTFFQHDPVTVLVNQRVTLNASSCENGEWRKVIPTQATIAKCKNYKCEIEKAYQKKYESGDMSNNLVFKSTKYNDQGTYQFICNGETHSYILDVLVPHNKTARLSSNITLMCLVRNAKDVTWIHNGKKILYHTDNGTTIIGEGYKGRVLLNDGCFEDGDCSLTLLDVREMDAGLYLCFADDESKKGEPHAYMLFVNADHSSPERNCTADHSSPERNCTADHSSPERNCTAVHSSPKGNCTVSNVLWWIINVVLAVALCIVSWFLYKAQSKAANQSTSQTQKEPSENDHMMTSNITEPVQESYDNAKSSSTVTRF